MKNKNTESERDILNSVISQAKKVRTMIDDGENIETIKDECRDMVLHFRDGNREKRELWKNLFEIMNSASEIENEIDNAYLYEMNKTRFLNYASRGLPKLISKCEEVLSGSRKRG